MSSKADSAVQCFSRGFNCAQAVFSAFAADIGFREEDALRVTTSLGAGMGRLQEVCGAVTGAIMVIGSRHGMVHPDQKAEKETAYSLTKEFAARFRQIHGAITCRDLLGCDLTTEEGKKEFREKKLSDQICRECVRDAARLTGEILQHDRP